MFDHIHCQNCGAPIEPDKRNCPYCDTPIVIKDLKYINSYIKERSDALRLQQIFTETHKDAIQKLLINTLINKKGI